MSQRGTAGIALMCIALGGMAINGSRPRHPIHHKTIRQGSRSAVVRRIDFGRSGTTSTSIDGLCGSPLEVDAERALSACGSRRRERSS